MAPYLGVINNPNALGTACNFVREGIELSQMPDSLWKGPYWGLGNCNAFDQPIPPDSIYTRTDTFICSNQDSLVLEGHFPAAWTYRWEDSSTTPVKAVYQPGIYWVESSNFCHYQVDTFVVRGVNVSFDLGPDTAICGLSYLLYVPLSQVRYLWQDGSTDSTYTADSSGTYWVQVSSEEGCVNSDSIRLRLIDVTQDLGDDQSICVGDPINVHLAANAPGGASVVWEDHSALPARNVTDTGTYWVRVTDPPCTGSDSVHIGREWCDCNLFVPSAFSPNGDGLNDVFLPVLQDPACQDLGNYALSIYNRYGQKVYEGYIRSRGWDGTVNGSPADAGTYMYFIRYQIGTRAALHVKKGDVTLLR